MTKTKTNSKRLRSKRNSTRRRYKKRGGFFTSKAELKLPGLGTFGWQPTGRRRYDTISGLWKEQECRTVFGFTSCTDKL